MNLGDKKRTRTDVYTYTVEYRASGELKEQTVTITFIDGGFESVGQPFQEPYSRFALGMLASIDEEVCKLEAAYGAAKSRSGDKLSGGGEEAGSGG